jgi:malate dehydrogenase (oxaloacetate-decarboxylating)
VRRDLIMQIYECNPSIGYSFTMQLSYPNRVGMFASIVQTIGKKGGDMGAVNIVSADHKTMARDITVQARDELHIQEIMQSVRELAEVNVVHFADRVFQLHSGGKISTQSKVPLTNREILSMAYTPGVARVCMAIAADPAKAYQYTIKGNSVAVVSDGTAASLIVLKGFAALVSSNTTGT